MVFWMISDPLGSFQYNPLVEDDEITTILRRKPRKTVKLSSPKPKKRKLFDAKMCDHANCRKFVHSFDASSLTFEFWRDQERKRFREHTYQGQAVYICTLVHFEKPRHSSRAKLWADPCSDHRNRYPKSYTIEMNQPDGFGRKKVCAQFLRHVYAIGEKKMRSLFATIWEDRREGRTMMNVTQNYKGYRNKEEEPQWRNDWMLWAITHKNLIRSHYTKDKDTVYFEPKEGVQETWASLWADFIKDTQPEAHERWLKKKSKTFIGPESNAPKPKPGYRQFVTVIPRLFKCKTKRLAQDCCNDCKYLQMLDHDAVQSTGTEDNDESLRLRGLHAQHLARASVAYQLNTHFKRLARHSFKKKKLVPETGTAPMTHPGTWNHVEFDYDNDWPECINSMNMTYFKQKITQKNLNVILHPGDENGYRKVFAWSGMVGGKASEETISCLEYLNKKRCIGAERAVWNCDGALLTYKLLQYAAFCAHPKNPNRYHRSIWITSPETGHSRLEADQINQQVSAHYKKKKAFGKCADRVQYLNETADLEVKQFFFFAEMPIIFDEIFMDTEQWKDQLGHKALIRNDKGLVYEFGESQEWNENSKKYEWIAHPDEMWIRCDDDFKKPMRKLRIFSEQWKRVTSQQLRLLRRGRKEPPVITRKALDDTLVIANCFPNREELFRYYTPTHIDEEGEIEKVSVNHNYTKIDTKLTRRNELKEQLRTGRAAQLTKYEKKEKDANADVCRAQQAWTISAIDDHKVVDLKAELKKHSEKVKGLKAELQSRLRAHYRQYHDADGEESE